MVLRYWYWNLYLAGKGIKDDNDYLFTNLHPSSIWNIQHFKRRSTLRMSVIDEGGGGCFYGIGQLLFISNKWVIYENSEPWKCWIIGQVNEEVIVELLPLENQPSNLLLLSLLFPSPIAIIFVPVKCLQLFSSPVSKFSMQCFFVFN